MSNAQTPNPTMSNAQTPAPATATAPTTNAATRELIARVAGALPTSGDYAPYLERAAYAVAARLYGGTPPVVAPLLEPWLEERCRGGWAMRPSLLEAAAQARAAARAWAEAAQEAAEAARAAAWAAEEAEEAEAAQAAEAAQEAAEAARAATWAACCRLARHHAGGARAIWARAKSAAWAAEQRAQLH